MLVGRADPESLAEGAPSVSSLTTEPLVLEDVETLQVLVEVPAAAVESALPPALHPTVPGLAGWVVQRLPATPWGEVRLAQMRLECRSGVRPRALLLAAYLDGSDAAASELASRWGYRIARAPVRLRRFYDRIEAGVGSAESPLLQLSLSDPEPLGADYLQYVAGLHPASTPAGLRLLQVDAEIDVTRAERGVPDVEAFDAAAWRAGEIEPAYPVSASFSLGALTLPRLRFVCRPEVWAFDGTEKVDAPADASAGGAGS